ncbi:chemotaxis protein, partial [Pseudomonas syringae pv. tagetis]
YLFSTSSTAVYKLICEFPLILCALSLAFGVYLLDYLASIIIIPILFTVLGDYLEVRQRNRIRKTLQEQPKSINSDLLALTYSDN